MAEVVFWRSHFDRLEKEVGDFGGVLGCVFGVFWLDDSKRLKEQKTDH